MIFLAILVAIPLVWFVKYKYSYLLRLRPLAIEQIAANLEAPVGYDFSIQELTPGGIPASQEYLGFPAPKTGLSVIRISEDPARKYILVMYENGKLRKWDIESKKLIAEYDFLAANFFDTFFNANGSFLITTGDIVWDPTNGERITCTIPGRCPDDATAITEYTGDMYIDPVRPVEIDYAAGFAPEWYSFDEKFVSSYGSKNGSLRCFDYLISDVSEFSDVYHLLGLEQITIDPSGHYLACSLSNGAIIVRDWTTAFDNQTVVWLDNQTGRVYNKEYPYIYLARYKMPGGGGVKNMTFDPTRTWLSVLADEEMVVWDLRRWVSASQLNMPIGDGNITAFDRAGKILALGTKRGITLYDVEQAEQIAEFDVGEVTALYFTRDNRLLVWGDTQGNVHLWGVAQK